MDIKKYTYAEVAKQIVCSYFEVLMHNDAININGIQTLLQIKQDKKALLEHIKAFKDIMEKAIEELGDLDEQKQG